MNKRVLDISLKLAAVLVVLAAYLGLARTDLYRFVETRTIDYRFLLRHQLAPSPPASPVIIVGIDDQALEQFPDPLIFWGPELARAIAAVSQGGPKVIGFDILHLAGPDSQRLPDSSQLLASIQSSRAAVIPFYFISQKSDDGASMINIKFPHYLLPFLQQMIPAEQLKTAPLSANLKYLEAVRKAGLVKNYGYANLPYDDDGVLRRVSLVEKEAASLSLAIYLEYIGADIKDLALTDNGPSIKGFNVPAQNDALPINFAGPPGTFPSLSLSAVLDHEHDPQFLQQNFAGKIVLIGAQSMLLGDIHATPYYISMSGKTRNMFGVEVIANAVNTLAARNFLATPPSMVTVLIIAGASLAAVFLLARIRPYQGAILLALACAAYLAVSLYAFIQFDLVMEVIGFMLFVPISYLAGYVGRAYLLDRDKRFIQNVFSHYLDPRLVEQLAASGDLGILKGQRREVTVLFTDVRGYSTFSESLPPETVVKVLNYHLTRLTEIIQDSGGMVISYAGDAIMAIWNAPIDLPQHRLIACQCALKMRDTMTEINAHIRGLGIELKDDLRIGIGINSGPAVVGNIGSERKSDYTAIGDTTNVAARLESMNKDFRTEILVSGEALNGLEERLEAKPLGPREIRGRKEQVEVFELVASRRIEP